MTSGVDVSLLPSSDLQRPAFVPPDTLRSLRVVAELGIPEACLAGRHHLKARHREQTERNRFRRLQCLRHGRPVAPQSSAPSIVVSTAPSTSATPHQPMDAADQRNESLWEVLVVQAQRYFHEERLFREAPSWSAEEAKRKESMAALRPKLAEAAGRLDVQQIADQLLASRPSVQSAPAVAAMVAEERQHRTLFGPLLDVGSSLGATRQQQQRQQQQGVGVPGGGGSGGRGPSGSLLTSRAALLLSVHTILAFSNLSGGDHDDEWPSNTAASSNSSSKCSSKCSNSSSSNSNSSDSSNKAPGGRTTGAKDGCAMEGARTAPEAKAPPSGRGVINKATARKQQAAQLRKQQQQQQQPGQGLGEGQGNVGGGGRGGSGDDGTGMDDGVDVADERDEGDGGSGRQPGGPAAAAGGSGAAGEGEEEADIGQRQRLLLLALVLVDALVRGAELPPLLLHEMVVLAIMVAQLQGPSLSSTQAAVHGLGGPLAAFTSLSDLCRAARAVATVAATYLDSHSDWRRNAARSRRWLHNVCLLHSQALRKACSAALNAVGESATAGSGGGGGGGGGAAAVRRFYIDTLRKTTGARLEGRRAGGGGGGSEFRSPVFWDVAKALPLAVFGGCSGAAGGGDGGDDGRDSDEELDSKGTLDAMDAEARLGMGRALLAVLAGGEGGSAAARGEAGKAKQASVVAVGQKGIGQALARTAIVTALRLAAVEDEPPPPSLQQAVSAAAIDGGDGSTADGTAADAAAAAAAACGGARDGTIGGGPLLVTVMYSRGLEEQHVRQEHELDDTMWTVMREIKRQLGPDMCPALLFASGRDERPNCRAVTLSITPLDAGGKAHLALHRCYGRVGVIQIPTMFVEFKRQANLRLKADGALRLRPNGAEALQVVVAWLGELHVELLREGRGLAVVPLLANQWSDSSQPSPMPLSDSDTQSLEAVGRHMSQLMKSLRRLRSVVAPASVVGTSAAAAAAAAGVDAGTDAVAVSAVAVERGAGAQPEDGGGVLGREAGEERPDAGWGAGSSVLLTAALSQALGFDALPEVAVALGGGCGGEGGRDGDGGGRGGGGDGGGGDGAALDGKGVVGETKGGGGGAGVGDGSRRRGMADTGSDSDSGSEERSSKAATAPSRNGGGGGGTPGRQAAAAAGGAGSGGGEALRRGGRRDKRSGSGGAGTADATAATTAAAASTRRPPPSPDSIFVGLPSVPLDLLVVECDPRRPREVLCKGEEDPRGRSVFNFFNGIGRHLGLRR